MSDIRARYGTNSLPELVRLLEAPEMQRYLRQTVLVIGVIGGEAGTDFLLRFLKRFSGEVSEEQMSAIRSVPAALGERARQGDRRALSFLLRHHTMQAWRDAPPSWWHGRKKDDALYQDLAHETLLGLAVVPDPQVSVVFEKLAHDPSNDYAELRRRLLDLPEILKLRQMVLKHLRDEAASPGREARDAQRKPGLVDKSSAPLAAQEGRDKIWPLPAEDAKSLAVVALREYQFVSQMFLQRPLTESAHRLADNGQPLVDAHTAEPIEYEPFLKQIEEDGSVAKSRAILWEIRSAGKQFGSASAFERDDGTCIVVIPIESSSEINKKHLPPGNPSLTVTRQREIAVVMIKKGDKWLWQPFGW